MPVHFLIYHVPRDFWKHPADFWRWYILMGCNEFEEILWELMTIIRMATLSAATVINYSQWKLYIPERARPQSRSLIINKFTCITHAPIRRPSFSWFFLCHSFVNAAMNLFTFLIWNYLGKACLKKKCTHSIFFYLIYNSLKMGISLRTTILFSYITQFRAIYFSFSLQYQVILYLQKKFWINIFFKDS